MQLSLRFQDNSLQPFEAELPTFTLVTGLNGSGKSQLLAAIESGRIECGFDRSTIRLFQALSFGINLGSSEHYEDFDNTVTRAEFLDRTAILNAELRRQWMEWGERNAIDEQNLVQLTSIAYRKIGNHNDLEFELHEKTDELYSLKDLLEELQKASNDIGLAPIQGNLDKQGILHGVQSRWGIPYFLLSARQLRETVVSHQALFDVSLGAIFTRYRDEVLRNRLARLAFEDGDTGIPPLSAEDFVDEKGPPPWDLINNLLSDLNVDARFEPPPSIATKYYQPLMITRDGTRFHPNDLSSGEKVILALATIGYAAADRRKIWKAPSLILLDEVDAPLHPAMAKTYLKVIKEVLIGQFGMHVIATTHSPSTVAQSDLEDVYVMKKGEPGLSRISTDKAISILTEGVPTLSVSLSSRRQVFAESPVEAANLDRLYHILKPSLNSQFSLQFIATGSKQTNSSKSDVERIVGDLVSAGNTSVYGIIDWDTTNCATDRIKVIAGGRRYALENIILDPLVLAAYLYKTLDKRALVHHGLDASLDVFSLRALEPEHWQSLADRVTRRVLGSGPASVVECRYHGGMAVNIDEAYLRYNAHRLEERVVEAYEMLEKTHRAGSGKLTAHLIEHVLLSLPNLIPVEVEEVFIELLGS
ncbi:AAA family ATPase [Agrobacterium tumefaciens]|uniref:AAA family ATPase n=1 Tax=Agrobacterium tumefaciens TaxID=358 RepID=UPI00277E27EE|nr:AAA family ATPase [Agrobacterium tumefaciens]MDP9871587.1 energy-coupling factor transporter ATP-binding protein EcfA2 [Agrobacterium tumefaciens]MDP9976692.1 energy-coupling factor transporter ATP-binding protein EcfA2 [Agrobacterium tumefaciens]